MNFRFAWFPKFFHRPNVLVTFSMTFSWLNGKIERMTDTVVKVSRSSRRALTAILTALFVFGAVDVVSDLGDGATWRHVTVECLGLLATVLVLGWIWKQNLGLKSETLLLGARLSEANSELNSWKAKSNTLVEGLGAAIDQQLLGWNLSGAEREVAFLLLKGLSFKEIGQVRGTSERTIRQQAQDIYRKSGLTGRAELSAFFLEDLLTPRKPGPN